MVEAGQTTVATAGIWAIVIVAVLLLGFWLTAVMLADRSQVRASGRARAAGGALPAGDDAEISQGEMPTRADLPAQPAAAGRPAMPRQRTGDADRAARSDAGRSTPDDEELGR